MLLLTGIYLVWELAFNARLLDVIGDVGDFKRVEALEVWGRLISGAALALVYVGYYLNKEAKYGLSPGELGLRWVWILIVCATLMTMMFFGQKWLIDRLVDSSSAESRRRAAVLVPITSLVKAGRVDFPSFNLTAEEYNTPQGKMFLATLPLQATSHPELFPKLEEVGVDRLFEVYAKRARGSEDEFFEIYRKSVLYLQESYHGRYTEATKAYQKAVGQDAKARKDSAWADYRSRLRERRHSMHPGNVPRIFWATVRRDVIASGIPVPQTWVPSDRATFNAAVDRAVREQALSEFKRGSKALVGRFESLAPGLSLDAFLSSPGIAGSWRNSLSLPGDMKPDPGMDTGRFERTVYAPVIAIDTQRMVKRNFAEVHQYERRGAQFMVGEQAYRALIVPPVALMFSLVGAVIHIFKIFLFAVKVVRPVRPLAVCGSLVGFVVVVGLVPLMTTNNVTEQDLFKRLQKHTQDHLLGGFIVAHAVRWSILFQPYFYPVNEFARTRILSSPKFETKLFFL